MPCRGIVYCHCGLSETSSMNGQAGPQRRTSRPRGDFFQCTVCNYFQWMDELGPSCNCAGGQAAILRWERDIQVYGCAKGREEGCGFFLTSDAAGDIWEWAEEEVEEDDDEEEGGSEWEDTSDESDEDEIEPAVPGLTQFQIDALPKQRVTAVMLQGDLGKDNDDCAICLESFRLCEVVRRFPCTHFFHKKCVDQWLLQSAACPSCRTSIYHE
mmetsp:Transcript_27518/g.50227  ORF Transcript_27518/g.50227 Transcript_27518/m.50227 type:complete len:213 (-) Transcript_27518:29-667(-)